MISLRPLNYNDTNLFLSGKNLTGLFNSMNTELKNITTWFKLNKLSINVKKTKWSLFHLASKKKLLPSNLPMLTIDNIPIEREKVMKLLGVLTDENLNWKNHIDYITNKVFKNIGILYQARNYISKSNLKQLYFSFIQSYISYSIIAWRSVCKSNLETFFCRQKHAIRAINFKKNYHHLSLSSLI